MANKPTRFTFEAGDDIPADTFNTTNPDAVEVYANGVLKGLRLFENKKLKIDAVLVAGGGGAGVGSTSNTYNAGGGGAGGLKVLENIIRIGVGSHAVVRGNGGAGSSSSSYRGEDGGDSTFLDYIARGGGGGGSYNGTLSVKQGNKGGSGGGNGNKNSSSTHDGGRRTQPILPIGSNYGNDGGGDGYYGKTGGGGGANGAGSTADSTTSQANGGAGREVWGTTYSRGGHGCNSDGASGEVNTGNGGNTQATDNSDAGGSGGTGKVIIRYKTTEASGMTITGGTKTTEGDYTYHTFTENGNFVLSYTQYNTLLSNFQTLKNGANDGKFSVNIDGTDYTDIAVILGTVNNLDDVASAVQTAIRARTGKTETVEWNKDHFIIESSTIGENSSVSKLTAPTSGTDITGASYLNLGENATEYLGKGEGYRLVRFNRFGAIPVSSGSGKDGDLVVEDGENYYLEVGKTYNFTSVHIKPGGKVFMAGTNDFGKVLCQGDFKLEGDWYMIGDISNANEIYLFTKNATLFAPKTDRAEAIGSAPNAYAGNGGLATGAGDGIGGKTAGADGEGGGGLSGGGGGAGSSVDGDFYVGGDASGFNGGDGANGMSSSVHDSYEGWPGGGGSGLGFGDGGAGGNGARGGGSPDTTPGANGGSGGLFGGAGGNGGAGGYTTSTNYPDPGADGGNGGRGYPGGNGGKGGNAPDYGDYNGGNGGHGGDGFTLSTGLALLVGGFITITGNLYAGGGNGGNGGDGGNRHGSGTMGIGGNGGHGGDGADILIMGNVDNIDTSKITTLGGVGGNGGTNGTNRLPGMKGQSGKDGRLMISNLASPF